MKSARILFGIAFIEGFSVLLLEILSKNVLAPWFGNSLTIWSIVIGNTFLFLSIGYLLGTRYLRKDKEKILALLFTLLAVLTLHIPFSSDWLAQHCMSGSVYSGAFKVHLLLFGPVFTFFGMINPLVIQSWAEMRKEQGYGAHAGMIFFISTLGGLLSSLIITLVFVSDIEIRIVFISLAVLLFALAFLLFGKKVNLILSGIFPVLLILAFSSEQRAIGDQKKLVYHSNDLFGDLKVMDEYDPGRKRTLRYLSVNNIPQTIMEKNSAVNSIWDYVHRVSMISSLKKNGNALLVGMGGGTIASELQKLNFQLDIVDIDKRMPQIARDYFYFQPGSSRFYNEDARYYINKSAKEYDLIVFDVLNGESQPTNLFTLEGCREIKQDLKDKGFVIIEFQESLAAGGIAYKSVCNTLLEEGFTVYNSISYGQISDVLIIAAKKPVDFSRLDRDDFTPNCKKLAWLNDFLSKPFTKLNVPFENALLLKDKQPVLEKLCEETRKKWRENSMNQILLNQ
ncbi:MAG: fused MFS/spermidine synthase [Bacteroidota bacterium]